MSSVLVVDDEPPVLRALTRVLSRSGYRVIPAGNAAEALALLQHETPDVVISDYRMPGMTGDQLLAECAKQAPSAIRILLSGYSDGVTTMDSPPTADSHIRLSKPWNDREIPNLLKDLLERRAASTKTDAEEPKD